MFFMRSGYSGIQRYRPLPWRGDQSVDFSRHDGMPNAIRAALSSGLVANPPRGYWRLHEPLGAAADTGAAHALWTGSTGGPVLAEGARARPVRLPAGADSKHLWSGTQYSGGQRVTVSALR